MRDLQLLHFVRSWAILVTRTMTMTLTISIFNNILHLISPCYSCLLSDALTCSPDCNWPRFARRGADCDYPAVCDDAAKVHLPLLGVTYSFVGQPLKCLARLWMKEMCCQFNYLLVCVCVLHLSRLALATTVDAVFVTGMLGVESAKKNTSGKEVDAWNRTKWSFVSRKSTWFCWVMIGIDEGNVKFLWSCN